MGITINYWGNLDDPEQVDEFSLQMTFRANELGWESWKVDERIVGQAYYMAGHEISDTDRPGVKRGTMGLGMKSVDDRIRGVMIQPPGTETLRLTFNRAGRLVSYTAMPGRFKPQETELGMAMSVTQESGYYLENTVEWVKTTGEVEAHVKIIELLRYAKDNFIGDLHVDDHSGYWDTGDRNKLAREHAGMSALIDIFREPAMAKALLDLAGIEGVENIEPVAEEDLILKEKKPGHMQNWGQASHEN